MDEIRTGKKILDAALEALRAQGVEARILAEEAVYGPTRADALVRIGRGPGAEVYAAEVKRNVTAATFGAVTHQLQQAGKPPLLVAEYIAPAVADRLKENRIAFIDTAGNAYVEQPAMLLWIKGQRPPQRPGVPVTGRAFQPGGLQVLFVLICRPELAGRPYREIAKAAGVAHGTVGWVMAELPALGFVAKIGRKRRLLQPERLLQQWAEGYARTLRPKLLLGRYQAETLAWWNTLDPRQYGLVLGGEPAAGRLTQYLRPGTATLFGAKVEPRFVLDHRLRADPRGNVEILRQFWHFDNDDPALAPTPLIYADLLAIGDARCLEIAKLLYDGIVNRPGR